MNKQITKLIIEANKYATEKHPIADDADSITKEIIVGNRIGESQRKLAELIVRECVKVMYDNAIERKVPPDINQTPTHYAIAVLEHFGVES